MERDNLKRDLAYIITRKEGLTFELERIVGKETAKSFETMGFIWLGKYRWYSRKFVCKYYKDLFGIFSYWYLIIKFKLKGKYNEEVKKSN